MPRHNTREQTYRALEFAPVVSIALFCAAGIYGNAATGMLQDRIAQARAYTAQAPAEVRRAWEEQLRQDRQIVFALAGIGAGSLPITVAAAMYAKRRRYDGLDEELRALFEGERLKNI